MKPSVAMRLFVAVNIPPSVRDAIYADAEPLRAATTGIRWVSSSALHVTLKFLGERDDSLVEPFQRAIVSVATRHAPVAVETTHIGAFPNFRRPRVVWVGMTGEHVLQALARDIDRALAPLGIPAETRVFQAHLTLGRVKSDLTPVDAAAVTAVAERRGAPRAFTVETVDLMRSELGAGGSRYSVLAAMPLTARGA